LFVTIINYSCGTCNLLRTLLVYFAGTSLLGVNMDMEDAVWALVGYERNKHGI
jgi:hypothetical protein